MRICLIILVVGGALMWASTHLVPPAKNSPATTLPATPRAELQAKLDEMKREGRVSADAQLMSEAERREWLRDPTTRPTTNQVR